MSSINIPLIILLSLITFFGKGDAQVTGFRFVQRWPQAVCNIDNKCNATVSRFTILGLWPHNITDLLVNCRGGSSEFHEELLQDFRKKMVEAWPDFVHIGGYSPDLWKAQWDEHGRCSEGYLTQREYFRRSSTELYPEIDILAKLEASGIKPDNEYHYVEDILRAFSNKVEIVCKTNSKDEVLLYQIHTCINLNLEIIDCRVPYEENCGGAAKFLKWTPY